LRLKPGDVLWKSNEWLGINDDVKRIHQIAELSIMAGSDVKLDQLIEAPSPVRGVIFARRSDVPMLDGSEPSGSA
jgi:hypothetical protein